jgi:hypothetical protein
LSSGFFVDDAKKTCTFLLQSSQKHVYEGKTSLLSPKGIVMTSEQEKADRIGNIALTVATTLKGSSVEIGDSTQAPGQHGMQVNHNGKTNLLELKFDWDNDKLLLVNRNEDLGPIDASPAKLLDKINEPGQSDFSTRVW